MMNLSRCVSTMNLSRCSHCTSTALLTGIIYGTMSIKRDLINVYSERYEGPRQLLSYTLKVGLSIMELRWPGYY